MTPKLKETMLLRKFSSIEYMKEFSEHYFNFIDAGFESVNAYKSNPPNVDLLDETQLKRYEGDLGLWESKVHPNFRFMYNSIITDIENAEKGNYEGVESAAADLRGLNKSMDGIRESFMDVIDPKIKEIYFFNLSQAKTKGDNIYRTLRGFWRPGAIHKESITGFVDEQELLRYLKPGELEN